MNPLKLAALLVACALSSAFLGVVYLAIVTPQAKGHEPLTPKEWVVAVVMALLIPGSAFAAWIAYWRL